MKSVRLSVRPSVCSSVCQSRLFWSVVLQKWQTETLNDVIIKTKMDKLKHFHLTFPRLKPHLKFIHWNTEGWKTGLCSVPPVGQPYSLLTLANNTCIHNNFTDLKNRFVKLYKRKVSKLGIWWLNAKRFYLLLYFIALRTISFTHLVLYRTNCLVDILLIKQDYNG